MVSSLGCSLGICWVTSWLVFRFTLFIVDRVVWDFCFGCYLIRLSVVCIVLRVFLGLMFDVATGINSVGGFVLLVMSVQVYLFDCFRCVCGIDSGCVVFDFLGLDARFRLASLFCLLWECGVCLSVSFVLVAMIWLVVCF